MIFPSIIKGSAQPLSKAYTLAFLDLDGVVYRGADPVANASDGIAQARKNGMRISYTTNNPSRYPSVVADQIRSFGVDMEDTDVITSAMVAAKMLEVLLPQGARVFVVGREHLKEEISKVGLKIAESAAQKPDAVIQSWYPDLAWGTLAEASYAIQAGAKYYVTNRDMTIPREGGIAPGNGAMQLPVMAATGEKPLASAGKPEAEMYHQARHMFSTTAKMIETEQSLPVGDRLDTDIEAANRGGYDSAVVLTGVADAAQIISADPIYRPTFICADLLGLNEVQPEVIARRNNATGIQEFTCNNATAFMEGNTLHIRINNSEIKDSEINNSESVEHTEPISSLDALRAGASAAWAAVDAGNVKSEDLIIPEFASILE